jgi:hypothetical protein
VSTFRQRMRAIRNFIKDIIAGYEPKRLDCVSSQR